MSKHVVEAKPVERALAPLFVQNSGAERSNSRNHDQSEIGAPAREFFPVRNVYSLSPSHASSSLLRLQRTYGNRYVQRVLALARQGEGEAEVTPEVESTIERARGGGQGLDHGVRRQMETAFGSDFSGVHVHTGLEAHTLNRAVSAVAFTTGQDIFFRDGAYDPVSSGGRELLAHELTHVVQQGGGSGVAQGKLVVGEPNDRYEREAELAASAVVRTIDAPNRANAAPLQRQCSCGGHEEGGECAACKSKREAGVQTMPVEHGAAVFDKDSIHRLSRRAVQRDPFDPQGTDSASCKDKIAEDGARCADHVNTACSVGGALVAGEGALAGGLIGSVVPVVGTFAGAVVGGLAGGIAGALTYGKCVEKLNAACRAKTASANKACDQKFSAAQQGGPGQGTAGPTPAPPTPTMDAGAAAPAVDAGGSDAGAAAPAVDAGGSTVACDPTTQSCPDQKQ